MGYRVPPYSTMRELAGLLSGSWMGCRWLAKRPHIVARFSQAHGWEPFENGARGGICWLCGEPPAAAIHEGHTSGVRDHTAKETG